MTVYIFIYLGFTVVTVILSRNFLLYWHIFENNRYRHFSTPTRARILPYRDYVSCRYVYWIQTNRQTKADFKNSFFVSPSVCPHKTCVQLSEERGKLNLDNCPLGDLAAELNLFTNYIEKTNLEKKMNEKSSNLIINKQ